MLAALVLLVIGLRPAQDTLAPSMPAVASPVTDVVPSQTSTAAPTPTPLLLGPVNTCVSQPNYLRSLNMGERPIIGTGARTATGFVVVDPATGAIYQDPTWDDAGDLGPYVYDRNGNFYVGPTLPAISPAHPNCCSTQLPSQMATAARYAVFSSPRTIAWYGMRSTSILRCVRQA